MSDLADYLANVEDQSRGRWFDILDPWTAQPTGMRWKLAGPDSEIQRRARLAMADRIVDESRADGTIDAETREAITIAALARSVIDWEMTEGGKSLPCEHRHIVRALSIDWLRQQVDMFASSRSSFGPEVVR